MSLLTRIRWFHLTRFMGAIVFLDQALIHTHGDDRGMIIVAACGLMGIDKVARD